MGDRLLLMLGLSLSLAGSMPYDGEVAAAYATQWANWRELGHDGFQSYFDQGGNCCKFVSRCGTQGGKLRFWGVKEKVLEKECYRVTQMEPDKDKFKKLLDNESHFISITNLKTCLAEWQIPITQYSLDELRSVPSQLNVGDWVFVPGHIMIVVEVDRENGVVFFADHHGTMQRGTWGCFDRQNLARYLQSKGQSGCGIAHMPSKIRDCMDAKSIERWDSTFSERPIVKHRYICCWHERLGEQPPWTSNPTPYACLSWEETSGTTWDTLILPRVNLAGCSSAVLVQSCTTNLQHGTSKTIEIRGSIDDGATWPYLIGADTTTRADIDWAAGQRNVRIAWIYKGPVQAGKFWCIDDVGILAAQHPKLCVTFRVRGDSNAAGWGLGKGRARGYPLTPNSVSF